MGFSHGRTFDLAQHSLGVGRGYEQRGDAWRIIQPASEEERPHLQRILAKLKSEGAIQEVGPRAYKLTDAGYSSHLAQITAWRDAINHQDIPAESGDLSPGLLLKIMDRFRERRSTLSAFHDE